MPDATPDLQIIVVTYNSLRAVERAAPHLRALAVMPSVAITIAENHSQDDTLVRCNEFAAACAAISIVPFPDNYGFGEAVNRVMAQSASPFILLLNLDVLLEPAVLAQMMTVLQEHGEFGGVTGVIRDDQGKATTAIRRAPHFLALAIEGSIVSRIAPGLCRSVLALPLDEEAIQQIPIASGCCLLLRRSCVEAIGGFDPRFFLYFEDADLCLRLQAAGTPVACISNLSIEHVGQAGSDASVRFRRRAWHQSHFRFSTKYLGAGWTRLLALLRLGDACLRAVLLAIPSFFATSRAEMLRSHCDTMVVSWRAFLNPAEV